MTSIILVDDEPDIRDSVQRTLEQAGYAVRVADSGTQGIAEYRRSPSDLLITDMIMPNGHGLDLIRELRADYPDMRILAISGGGNFGAQSYQTGAISTTAYLAAATAAGAKVALTKPFTREKLLAAVQEALK
ncbi:MAG: response regulator [Gammaproteobacteria bacterium]|nr:response regulator [Gammaproteobacteria bacterium]